MSRTRLGLLGLCAAIFAVMAFGASAAQANEWLILVPNPPEPPNSPILKTAAELPASIVGSLEGNDGALLSEILGAKVKFLCTAGTLIGTKIETGGKLTNGGKVQFTGCKVFLEEEEAPECEAKSAGKPNGTIESNAGKGELALHEGKIVTKITPSVGTVFVTIQTGAACPIGANVPIEGELVIEDCEGKAHEHLVTHLIEEEEVLSTLTALGEPATIDGSALIKLSGAHTGMKWGADA